jgi:Rho termination factor, N-terminal domain
MQKANVRPSVKDSPLYKVLRHEGIKKAKAVRIANAVMPSSGSRVPKQNRRSAAYEKWTKSDLLARARKVGVTGRSSMRKSELVTALRGA